VWILWFIVASITAEHVAPLRIGDGDTTSTDVTFWRANQCEIVVGAGAPVSLDSVAAILGGSPPLEQDHGLELPARPVLMEWRVTRAGGDLAKGSTQGRYRRDRTYFGRDNLSRTIGMFSARSGERCHVAIVLRGDASALVRGHPTLTVRTDPDELEMNFGVELLRLVGVFLLMVGLALWAAVGMFALNRRRQPAA
jgi:hypothetical protein